MPKINRIRITNFTYNKRNIVDEIFNLYDGENALFSLANGGGKSVLVQTIMQPILPKAKLLNRKFGNFFVGKKDPAYIMIEWKLDDAAGYLLTGIAISTSVNYSANSEEDNNSLRYFTFIHPYLEGNPFDIKHIPIAREHNNGISIVPYNEIKKVLKNESGKSSHDILLFNSSKDQQRDYERNLASYSISRNEWKDLMIRINQAEHGVSEVFSTCKNSRQVMEQWIIKYIEKVLDKSTEGDLSDHQKLERLMAEVAYTLVENENHIRDYEDIKEFIKNLNIIEKRAEEVLNKIDIEETVRDQLVSACHYLCKKRAKAESANKQFDLKIKECQKEIEHIQLEEKSFEIYKAEDEVDQLKEKFNIQKTNREYIEEELKNINREIVLQDGARNYTLLIGKLKVKAKLLEDLNSASKSEKELMDRMNQVKYSLREIYNNQIKLNKSELENHSKDLEKEEYKLGKLKETQKNYNKEIAKLSSEKGKLEEQIGSFVEYEKKTLCEIKVELHRNPLIHELDKDEIEEIEGNFNKQQAHLEKTLNKKETRQLTLKADIKTIQFLLEELNKTSNELTIRMTETNNIIDTIKKEKKVMKELILKYLNDKYDVYQKKELLNELNVTKNRWEKQHFNLQADIQESTKMIEGIQESISYIPATLVNVLKENNISFFTGEKYLKEQPINRRKEIVMKNPLLPYGLIVTEKEYTLISSLLKDVNLISLVPLFTYDNKEKNLEELPLDILKNAKLLTMEEDTLLTYIETIQQNMYKKTDQIEQMKQTIKSLSDSIKIVEDFQWTQESVQQVYQTLGRYKARLEENSANIMEQKNSLKCFNNEIEQNLNQIGDIKEEIRNLDNNNKLFKEYLVRNEVYINNIRKMNEIINSIAKKNNQLEEYEKEQINLNSKISRLNDEIRTKQGSLKSYNEKYKSVSGAYKVDVLEEEEEILEGKLESYENKRTNNVSELEKQIKLIDIDTENYRDAIHRIGLREEECRAVQYNQETERKLKASYKKKEEQNKSLGEAIHKMEINIAEIEREIKVLITGLNNKGKLERELIKGNFELRILSQKDKLEELNGNKKDNEKDIDIVKESLIRVESKLEMKIADISAQMDNKSFIVDDDGDIKVIIASYIEKYSNTQKELRNIIKMFRRANDTIQKQYTQSSNKTIVEALKGIQVQMEGLSRTYDKYYHLVERIGFNINQLDNMLKLMHSKIEKIEQNKMDLVEHGYIEAMRIYNELPKIVDNSTIDIDGVRRKILDIQYSKIQDDEIAKEKISNYIQLCLSDITENIKNDVEESKIQRNIEKYVSSKELLTTISNLEECKIKAYKVDINVKNRKMMDWEEIIVKNSGGEKFVAYFSLLVALISYSRKNVNDLEVFKKREESKVLIMDNPFGPITSGHLLKPMFDIAKKYDTQLICLSDIKEGAVINSFNLVYNIKIRENMMKQEFLEINEQNIANLKFSEKLEKVYLYSYAQQRSLFE